MKQRAGFTIAAQRRARDHAIEGPVWEGKPLAAPRAEFDQARDAPQLDGQVDEPGRCAQADDAAFPHATPGFLHQPAVAALDEKHPIPSLHPHLIEEPEADRTERALAFESCVGAKEGYAHAAWCRNACASSDRALPRRRRSRRGLPQHRQATTVAVAQHIVAA